jgi:DNA-directed RNA polymerase specialized sigma subunit
MRYAESVSKGNLNNMEKLRIALNVIKEEGIILLKEELESMKKRKGWSSAVIYSHYWMSDKTLDEVSKDIRISKSTVFLAVKKVKKHLKNNIQNPFNND